MFSLDDGRSRQRFHLRLTSALLLAMCGLVSVAAAQTEASERRQKVEELRDLNADAERNAHELRAQIDELEAEAVDRGLLLTLDDGVFNTNNISLSSSGHRRLDSLAAFLKQHPQRTVAIDGYAGADGYRYDQALSKRRAEAVKAYLIRQDIAPSRLTIRTRGSGEALQDYEDSAIRQQLLRRIEVIIEDPLTSVPRSM